MAASRDFLGVFGGGERAAAAAEGAGSAAGGESDEIELSLGLSLGGRFGTDRWSPEGKRQRLARSSSIASVCSVVSAAAADGDLSPAAPLPLPLLRTSSLPTETEEERWRRRRMEARRKRLERRSSMSSSSPLPGSAKPSSGSRDDGGNAANVFQLRRSTGSQASSSSANTQKQGLDRNADTNPSASENTKKNIELPAAAATAEPPRLRTLGSLTMARTSSGGIGGGGGSGSVMMEDMPMVSSKVEGPNGRRIDGFLYRYSKGEDVRIVCVCHGSFLTPAEFVKHAGGGDVPNPLRHIVVNPAPSLFL